MRNTESGVIQTLKPLECSYITGILHRWKRLSANHIWERLGYVWRRERRRHVGWLTKLGSHQRDLSTLSVTKLANGHWHPIIASSCRWSQREYKRQQVHRINHAFAKEQSRRPGRSAMVQQLWRRDVTSPFPPSGNEGYIRNWDVPFQIPTKAPQELPLPAPCVGLLILPIRQTIGLMHFRKEWHRRGALGSQRDPQRETTRPASNGWDAVEDSTRARCSRRPGKA